LLLPIFGSPHKKRENTKKKESKKFEKKENKKIVNSEKRCQGKKKKGQKFVEV